MVNSANEVKLDRDSFCAHLITAAHIYCLPPYTLVALVKKAHMEVIVGDHNCILTTQIINMRSTGFVNKRSYEPQ